ncbi:hypothetical protein ACIBG0_21085 [Nocardia sp. NPDC050630]|uniref:hypothetical protein n=1 Tax=Nocardia sp. NPDC050630 TaxID=3364321 RepID=UPI003788D852
MGVIPKALELASSWQSITTLLMAVGVFGFCPGFILRLLVKVYPKDDARRRELPAELYAMNLLLRPFWVAQQFETVIFEGTSLRYGGWKINRKEKQMAIDSLDVFELLALQAIADADATEDDTVVVQVIPSGKIYRKSVREIRQATSSSLRTRIRYRFRSHDRRHFMFHVYELLTSSVQPAPTDTTPHEDYEWFV